MPVTIQNSAGQIIDTLPEWLELAPPAKGEKHWKDFRSAKELGQAWLRSNPHEVPKELLGLLNSRNETAGATFHKAIPERRVPLDNLPRGQRNTDLVAYGQQRNNKIVVSLEAKADDPFGKIIQKELAANPHGNLPERIAHLCQTVFGQPVNEQIAGLRYQLLYGLVATVIEAEKEKADYAVFVVHEFISLALDFQKLVANARDMEAFIRAVPGWEGRDASIGNLLPPIH